MLHEVKVSLYFSDTEFKWLLRSNNCKTYDELLIKLKEQLTKDKEFSEVEIEYQKIENYV